MTPDELDELHAELYNIRLLVFLEETPQSNKYRQVLFDADQFKEVSLKIGEVVFEQNSKQEVSLELSGDTYDLPDLKQINPPEEEV